MENYKSIATKYLKMNKRRTILTILGTGLTVLILYLILNLGLSYLDYMKGMVLEQGNYEMVFYTETPEQVQQISSDARVKEAYVGGYFDAYSGVSYEQALYVIGNSPYAMDKNFKYLSNTYGVEGQQNMELGQFYGQGNNGSVVYIISLLLILVSYIFAIFGVGVIRNSIQLSLFEQIKDYGNLRCIGASKGQLRTIIYTQGAIMELAGIVIGVLVGQLGMSLVGLFINFDMRMHVSAILFVIVAYLGDLYFAMEENCKLVTGMTPVSALKGEFRIKKEKYKKRKRSIWARFFGFEGDYAYKSLMRNPGKFYKSVGAMLIGIVAMVACISGVHIINTYINGMEESYGYYQHYYLCHMQIENSLEECQKNMPDKNYLQRVTNVKSVAEVKRIYQSQVMLVDSELLIKHMTDSYARSMEGEFLHSLSVNDDTDEAQGYRQWLAGKIDCYGYDDEDYKRYEQYLEEGTLETSENGIVVVNGARLQVLPDSSEGAEEENTIYDMKEEDVVFTDLKVGDTVDIVDPVKLKEMVLRETKDKDELGTKLVDLGKIYMECKEKLIAEGAYQTYTIEGVLSKNINIQNTSFSIVMPLEKYYAFTGEDENSVVGMAYHIDGDLSVDEMDAIMGYMNEEKDYDSSSYIEFTTILGAFATELKVILGIALFVMIVSSVNIINTTASNIHLRRKEFAQLRVIGVSKKRLLKMVMLEGVISAIIANVIGGIIGNLLAYGVYKFAVMMLPVEYEIPWVGMLVGLISSVLVLCGSVYVPIKQMRCEMAEELAASGE